MAVQPISVGSNFSISVKTNDNTNYAREIFSVSDPAAWSNTYKYSATNIDGMPLDAKWIYVPYTLKAGGIRETDYDYVNKPVHFYKIFNNPGAAYTASLHIVVDNFAKVVFNGTLLELGASGSTLTPDNTWNMTTYPKVSVNVLSGINKIWITVVDTGGAAGIVAALIKYPDGVSTPSTRIPILYTDSSWIYYH